MTPPPKRRKVDAEPSPSLSTPPSTTTSLPPLSPALLPLAPNPPLYPHQRLERILIPPGRSRSHGGAGTPNSPVNSNSSPSTDPTSVPKGLLSQASIHRQASRGSPVVSSSSGSGPGRGDALSLEGYKDVRIISVHYDDTVVCRAVSTTRGDMKVFIKLSLSANPIATASFKAEATLLATLHEAGVHNVSKIISREVGKLGAMLIAEDERVTFFKDVFFPPERTSAPHWTDSTTILHALDACVQLVRLISSIHSLSIVHGAIRPSTVSFSVFSEVHIHDFSCAFRSAASTEGVIAPVRERGMREESLPYLAPECTGRVGKSADYRSDYYSIGALMFEMFTGRTPFAEAIDPLEVIHAHIARRPLLATYYDHSIPEPLAQLIAKLLEKSPDARYQTSQGLIVDLEKIMDLIRRNSSKLSRWCPEDPAFVIGSIDEAAHFRLPPATRMYGRTASLETLLASYARVEKTGKSEVVIIKGLSGTGKSSLTETVRKPVLRSLGYYTTVKFGSSLVPSSPLST
jgi:serine/threonine protein kinase